MNKGFWQRIVERFSSRYVLLYTALSDAECIQVKGKLIDPGIVHKTKVRGIYATSTRGTGLGRKQSQYDIYVAGADEHRAYEAIHK